MKNIKTILQIILIPIGVISVLLLGYLFMGFLDWLFSDPLNLIEIPEPPAYVEPIDFQNCRDKGGVPVRSAWDGRLKRCELLSVSPQDK